MVKRRTRALVELVVGAVQLLVLYRLWKTLLDDEEWKDPARVSVPGLATGVLYRAAHFWVKDRDIAEIRTNRYRGLAFSVCSRAIRRRLLPDEGDFSDNFDIGQVVGTVVYRLWYGLLSPLPGPDE